ncbi:hypothetical protein M5D96_000969, partial [Drosophila gunungcola]
TDGTESPILAEDGGDGHDKPRLRYGELVILGYNGYLPQGDRGRRRSKFVLHKRTEASGVKRSKHYIVQSPQTSKAILDANQHSISYTLSRNQAVIVEYKEDAETDMFQVGRSSESPIDFVVMDTLPGDKKDAKVMQSTISRFACRILVNRCEPAKARIFAAGFDSSRNIFLGTKHDLEKLIDAINAGRPQCPVGLNTLVIPRKVNIGDQVNQPYVYLNCGHVQGHHDWGQDENTGARRCPMCLELGPVVTLCMGLEPAFYVDVGAPTYAFNPCGHMATEKTVKYWANVEIPHGTNGFQAVCPFCATPLDGATGYIKLIFQDNLD